LKTLNAEKSKYVTEIATLKAKVAADKVTFEDNEGSQVGLYIGIILTLSLVITAMVLIRKKK